MILLWWTQIIISLSIMKLSLPLDDVRTDWSTCTYFFFSMNLYLDDLGRPMTSTFNPDSIAVSLFVKMILREIHLIIKKWPTTRSKVLFWCWYEGLVSDGFQDTNLFCRSVQCPALCAYGLLPLISSRQNKSIGRQGRYNAGTRAFVAGHQFLLQVSPVRSSVRILKDTTAPASHFFWKIL